MQINNSNLNTSDWEKTFRTTLEVRGFIASLNPVALKGSKAKFDGKTFSLIPTNWIEEDPFLGTQDAFFRLREKAQFLEEVAERIITTSNVPSKQVMKWHQFLVEVVQYIDLYARQCLAGLVDDYKQSREIDKANCFQQMGKDIFAKMEDIDKELTTHFKSDKDYQERITLQRYTYHALPIITRWQENRKHLEEVHWNEESGVVLPESLINDCLKDLEEKENMSKELIRNAANCISIPRKAEKIKILLGEAKETHWIPLHPMTNKEKQIEFDPEGVRGTCERGRSDHENEEGICNVYYFVDPDLVDQNYSQIVISSGVIDTYNKTMQLASCIQRISESNPGCTSKRFVLFQLNSFLSGEGDLILNAHQAASDLETILKKEEQDPEMRKQISVLHLNVAFNACTDYPLEKPKSLQINQKGLLQLSHFVLEYIEKLTPLLIPILRNLREILPNSNEILPNKSPKPKAKSLDSNYKIILKEIKQSIQEIRRQSSNKDFKPHTGLDKAILLLELLYLNIGSQFASDEVPKFTRCTEVELLLLLFKLLDINIVVICRSGLDRSGSVRSILIALSHLARRFYVQPEIEIEEKDFIFLSDETVEEKSKPLEDSEDEIFLENQILSFDRLFNESVEEEDYSIADQDEIKDPLLVDSADSLINLSQEDPERVRTRTYNKLLQFVLHYESNEEQLNQIIYHIITTDQKKVNEKRAWFAKKKEPYMTDLLQLGQIEAQLTKHPRDQLLKALENYSNKSLREVLFYQEIIMASLIRESIKTLFSTGVVGVKYHQDADYFTRTFGANAHPMQRWPTFVNLEKNDHTYVPIQIKKTNKTWKRVLSWEAVFNTEIIKPIVTQLFLRMSQKRGD